MKRTLVVLACLHLASGVMMSGGADVPAANVRRFEVYELTLHDRSPESNPYVKDLSVSATFTGPQGITKTVEGFWDGDKTFRIRFAPTVLGAWSYTTSSFDAGLNGRSGTVNCVAPAPGNHGFLRRDANHPGHFVWDDGTRCFLWGQTHYDILRNAMAGDNWKTGVDNARKFGMNKIRFRVYPKSEESPTYPDSQPFAGGGASPDHDVLNLAHWRKLDEVVRYLDSKGTVAELIFFSRHRRVFGTPAQDERYVRYILARFAAYRNVIWCLANEWNYTIRPQAFWNMLGGIVRREDPWSTEGPNVRALSIHQQTRPDWNFADQTWPSHAVIQLGVRNRADATRIGLQFPYNAWDEAGRGGKRHRHGDEWGNHSIVRNGTGQYPVVNDEYGYIGEPNDESERPLAEGSENEAPLAESKWPVFTREKHRHAMWGIAVAGGYGSTGDHRALPNGNKPYFAGDWRDAPEYGDIRRLVDFFTTKGIEYWKMSSQNALVTSGRRVYVLAEVGRQYVIYAATGGTFSVKIAPGTYAARRFNPGTGEEVDLPDVAGGGPITVAAPDGNDSVFYLRNAAK